MLDRKRLIISSKESALTMSNSGEKINYTVRPAKSVERKIICEIVENAELPTPISNYRYIGFGSFYFVDFILFHNTLNIDKMISIERSGKKERFDFNKPYNCIEMCYMDCNAALIHGIPFDGENPDIVWLDYDSSFCKTMINEISTAAQKVAEGSFIFSSFNVDIDCTSNPMDTMNEICGEYLPAAIQAKHISGNNVCNIIFKSIVAAVEKSIYERNSRYSSNISATTVFYVTYSDGIAKMMSIGFYIANTENSAKLLSSKSVQCPFFYKQNAWSATDLNIYRPSEISVPCLTKAEIREINKLLPGNTNDDILSTLTAKGIVLNKKDIERYVSIYKYYPNYFDASFYT